MSSMIQKIIVIGAGGNIGGPIVSGLLASGIFQVSALTRPSSKTDLPPAGLLLRLSDQRIPRSSRRCVVSAIATSNLIDQNLVINAAAGTGLKRFIPSEFRWDTSVAVGLEMSRDAKTYMSRDSGEKVQYIRRKDASSMSWTSIVNGLWFHWATAQPEWPWWSIKDRTFTIFDGGDMPFEVSSLAQVARTINCHCPAR